MLRAGVDTALPNPDRRIEIIYCFVGSASAEHVRLKPNLLRMNSTLQVACVINQIMKVIQANPRGFCAGVDRAIDIVERALELFGTPIYVRHEVVHNRYVVNDLKSKGTIFVDELDEVPDNATVIFSAHGVAKTVFEEASRRELNYFDATCPLVTKVHMEVRRYSQLGHDVVLIGHEGHPEVIGTMGQYNNESSGKMYLVEDITDVSQLTVNNPEQLHYVTQTTLSVDDTDGIINALKSRFTAIQGPKKDDICYATQNRQDAVKKLARQCGLMLVVGSPSSSNSNRLREIAEQTGGIPAYLIDDANDIEPHWLEDIDIIGLTAGASAPEILVSQVCERLTELGASGINDLQGTKESIIFALPKALR